MFWDVMLCSQVDCLPKYGGKMLRQSSGNYLSDYTQHIPEDSDILE